MFWAIFTLSISPELEVSYVFMVFFSVPEDKKNLESVRWVPETLEKNFGCLNHILESWTFCALVSRFRFEICHITHHIFHPFRAIYVQ